MGSDARVYVFDYETYVAKVVPVVRHWLLTFEFPSQAEWKLLSGGKLPEAGTNLAAHSTSIGYDLRYLGRVNRGDAWSDSWEQRGCESETCESRPTCPWYVGDGDEASTVNELVIGLMARYGCFGDSRFVGRSMNTGGYQEFLTNLGIPLSARPRRLLEILGSRGRMTGWIGSNSDGVHGWLDPVETGKLADDLRKINLPDYDMAAKEFQGLLEGTSAVPFEAEGLGIVRTLCDVAKRAGMGVLWGNDIERDVANASAEP